MKVFKMPSVSYDVSIIASLLIHVGLSFTEASAHAPHDVIDDLVISPNYAEDQTVFVIVHGELKKSESAGMEFRRLHRGLTNRFPLSAIAVSPNFARDSTLIAASYGGSIFVSSDAGESWRSWPSGFTEMTISDIEFCNNLSDTPEVIAIAQSGAIFQTELSEVPNWSKLSIKTDSKAVRGQSDTGAIFDVATDRLLLCTTSGWDVLPKEDLASERENTQDAVFQRPTPIFRIKPPFQLASFTVDEHRNKHFEKNLWSNRGSGIITAVAISPNIEVDDTVCISTEIKGPYCTTNRGISWVAVHSGLTSTDQALQSGFPNFTKIAFSPNFASDRTLFLAGFDGLFKSTDFGRNWVEMETRAAKDITSFDIFASSNNALHLSMATYDAGAYFSRDGGQTCSAQNRIGLHQHLWLAHYTHNGDGEVFALSNKGIFHSEGTGLIWRYMPLVGRVDRLFDKTFRSENFIGWARAHFAHRVFGTELKPIFPTTIASASNTSGQPLVVIGTRYRGIWAHRHGTGDWQQLLKRSETWGWVDAIGVAPSETGDLSIFALTDGKLIRSTDGGSSWKELRAGFQTFRQSSVMELPLELSPQFAQDRTVLVGGMNGVWKSKNAGVNWKFTRISDGIVNAFVISPNFGNDKKVFASVKGKGLYLSKNAGESFRRVFDIGFDQIRLSPTFARDRSVFGLVDGHVYRSRDGGSAWEAIECPVRHEENYSHIAWRGDWRAVTGSEYSGGGARKLNEAHGSVRVASFGSGFRVLLGGTLERHNIEMLIDGRALSPSIYNARKSGDASGVWVAVENLAPDIYSFEVKFGTAETPYEELILDAVEVLP